MNANQAVIIVIYFNYLDYGHNNISRRPVLRVAGYPRLKGFFSLLCFDEEPEQ